MLDNYIFSKQLVKGKDLHHFIRHDGEENYSLKAKLYNDTSVFINKDKQVVNSIDDLYKYLKEGDRVRLVVNFSKMWVMGKEYGFSISVKRLQIIPSDKPVEEEAKT